MGFIFLILFVLKMWGAETYFINVSWGWVVMPIAMEAWYQLNKSNNQ